MSNKEQREFDGPSLKQLQSQSCDRCLALNMPEIMQLGPDEPFPEGRKVEFSGAVVTRYIVDEAQNCWPADETCASCKELSRRAMKGFKLTPEWATRSDGSLDEPPSLFRFWGKSLSCESPLDARRLYLGFPVKLLFAGPTGVVLGAQPSYQVIRSWLSDCQQSHPACGNNDGHDLSRISLIDVEARRVVPHPGNCQYLALSYVWGGAFQPQPDADGFIPERVPQTIQDAMTVVTNLGYRYLWVDALCIDQANEGTKKEQIQLMEAIYEDAVATIVCLEGNTAEAGLPGVGKTPRIPQEMAGFNGFSFCQMEPPEDVTGHSVWSSRGWTFQEFVLSKRRIFFSRRQCFFVCNTAGVRYSEDCKSRFTQMLSLGNGGLLAISGLLQCPRRRRDMGERSYLDTVANIYFQRQLSYDNDALSAFNALLVRASKAFEVPNYICGLQPKGFFHALLWKLHSSSNSPGMMPSPPTRIRRRKSTAVPSWSWLGWEAREARWRSLVLFAAFFSMMHDLAVPLRISYRGQDLKPGRPAQSSDESESPDPSAITNWKNFRAGFSQLETAYAHIGDVERPACEHALLIRGIVLDLPCVASSRPASEDEFHEAQRIDIQAMDRFRRYNVAWNSLPEDLPRQSNQPFLIVTTLMYWGERLHLNVLMLKWRDGFAERAGTGEICLGEDESCLQGFLRQSNARHVEFWLA